MRRSQFTDSEIMHLLLEADAGVPVAEICRTSQVSLRTFYRWRKRFGGLTPHAVRELNDLKAENRRLRALVGSLTARLNATETHADLDCHDDQQDHRRDRRATPPHGFATMGREGVGLGRFAGVRITR